MQHNDMAEQEVNTVTLEVVRIYLAKDNHGTASRGQSPDQLLVQTTIVEGRRGTDDRADFRQMRNIEGEERFGDRNVDVDGTGIVGRGSK